MTAIIDTGPLLVFTKLQRLHLLDRLYSGLSLPQAVYHEAVTVGLERGYPDAAHLQAFQATHHWPIMPPVALPALLAGALLGEGERQAIAIAQATGLLLLIDDSNARRMAQQRGVSTRGSLGVIVQAFRQSLLTDAELDEILSTIENRTDIWIRPELCGRVRQSLLHK